MERETHLAEDDGSDATLHQEAEDPRRLGDGADPPLTPITIVHVRRVPHHVLLLFLEISRALVRPWEKLKHLLPARCAVLVDEDDVRHAKY